MRYKSINILASVFILIALAATLFITVPHAKAAAYTSTQAGAWTDTATWGNSGPPGAGDTVSIGHAVTNGSGTIANLTITTGGSLQLGGNLTVTATGGNILDLAGNIDLNGYTMELSGDGGNIQVCGARTVSGGAGSNFLMTSTHQTTKTVVSASCGSDGLTFGNTVQVEVKSVTWNFSWFNPGSGLTTINGTLRVSSGGVVVTNSPLYGSSSTLEYGGTSQTKNVGTEWAAGSSGAGVPQNVVLEPGTLALTLLNDGARTVLGNFTMNGGNILTLGGADAADLHIKGNWINNGGSLNGTGYINGVVFSGTSLQTIGGSGNTTFVNLKIDNPNDVKLLITALLSRKLTMLQGNLDLDIWDLTITEIGSITNSPPSSDRMIIADQGRLCKIFTGSGSYTFTFPIGDNSGPSNTEDYSPFRLYLPDTNYDTYKACVKVIDDKHPVFDPTYYPNYLTRYWKVTKEGGTPEETNFTGVFTYVPGDIVGTETDIYSTRYNFNIPDYQFYAKVDDTNNEVKVTDVSMLSEGDYTGLGANPSAVTMTDMSTFSAPGALWVRWTTAQEQDTSGFNVYRAASPDGVRSLLTPSPIPSQAPGGLTGASYEFADSTAQPGITYYYWIETVESTGSAWSQSLQGLLNYYILLPVIKR